MSMHLATRVICIKSRDESSRVKSIGSINFHYFFFNIKEKKPMKAPKILIDLLEKHL